MKSIYQCPNGCDSYLVTDYYNNDYDYICYSCGEIFHEETVKEQMQSKAKYII